MDWEVIPANLFESDSTFWLKSKLLFCAFADQWRLFKKNQGGRGAEFAEYSEVAKYLSSANVFHKKRVYQKVEVQGKVALLLKKVYFAFFPLLLPRICYLDDSWGHFTPLAP